MPRCRAISLMRALSVRCTLAISDLFRSARLFRRAPLLICYYAMIFRRICFVLSTPSHISNILFLPSCLRHFTIIQHYRDSISRCIELSISECQSMRQQTVPTRCNTTIQTGDVLLGRDTRVISMPCLKFAHASCTI